MAIFNRKNLRILPLTKRESKSFIKKIAIDPEQSPDRFKGDYQVIVKTAQAIKEAKKQKRAIIVAYGAHLIKNGLGPVLRKMCAQGYITHLATNGAGTIHDWEFAFQGKSEENVRNYISKGQFGIWYETGKYLNLAILLGLLENRGYGESVGWLIEKGKLEIPTQEQIKFRIQQQLSEGKAIGGLASLYDKLCAGDLVSESIEIAHPFKSYSLSHGAFQCGIPLTVHPGFGYDIIYSSPYNSGGAIGQGAEIDFLRFVESVSRLNGGVYLSVGSAIMSPMVLEKSLSMARNIASQKKEEITDFLLVVNDIQKGQWEWGSGQEPPKTDPAYYLRFCKSFDRMNPREMHYACVDNRSFLLNLYHCLKKIGA